VAVSACCPVMIQHMDGKFVGQGSAVRVRHGAPLSMPTNRCLPVGVHGVNWLDCSGMVDLCSIGTCFKALKDVSLVLCAPRLSEDAVIASASKVLVMPGNGASKK